MAQLTVRQHALRYILESTGHEMYGRVIFIFMYDGPEKIVFEECNSFRPGRRARQIEPREHPAIGRWRNELGSLGTPRRP